MAQPERGVPGRRIVKASAGKRQWFTLGRDFAKSGSSFRALKYILVVDPARNEMAEHNRPFTFRWTLYGALAVLAGIVLLLPLVEWRHEPGVPRAPSEISNLRAAIMQFEAEYNYLPAAEATVKQSRDSDSDLTFGIPDLLRLANSAPTNAELMNVLLARETGPNQQLRNSRRVSFMDLKQAQPTNDSGLGPDGVYRDPWGNPYIVTLDLNGDGYCEDALYSRPVVSSKTVGKPGSLNFESSGTGPNAFRLKTPIMIWSMGPDGEADPNIASDQGVNADNIVSWE